MFHFPNKYRLVAPLGPTVVDSDSLDTNTKKYFHFEESCETWLLIVLLYVVIKQRIFT